MQNTPDDVWKTILNAEQELGRSSVVYRQKRFVAHVDCEHVCVCFRSAQMSSVAVHKSGCCA
eukprot:scaffold91986_cov21-Tisochrysis_lutea.AAC.2